MAIDLRPDETRPGAKPSASNAMVRGLPDPREPGCCEPSDRHHSLILTHLDGTSEGFPLTWLYRWQWRKEPAHEVLTLTLTEHEIAIQGKNLDGIPEHLAATRGLHLRVRDDRYQSLRPAHTPQIRTITVQPISKPEPSHP